MRSKLATWPASCSNIRRLAGRRPRLLPGHRVRVLDGNHLAATDRRLAVLRDQAAGPLPGQALVVYDPDAGLVASAIREKRAAEKRNLYSGSQEVCFTGISGGLASNFTLSLALRSF